MTHEERLQRLIDGTLPAACFGHREHVGVAAAALARFEPFEAMAVVARGLRALTLRAGVPVKFHATITLGYMALIADRMAEAPGSSDSFLDANPDLMDGSALKARYGTRLADPQARALPLLPMLGNPLNA